MKKKTKVKNAIGFVRIVGAIGILFFSFVISDIANIVAYELSGQSNAVAGTAETIALVLSISLLGFLLIRSTTNK